MPDDKDRGPYEKYIVERTDGKPVGRCIILEFKDPIARVGIMAWADEMERNGYEAVATDVRSAISELSPPTTHPCPKCGGDGAGWSMGVGGEPEWWECETCKTTGELSPPTTPESEASDA